VIKSRPPISIEWGQGKKKKRSGGNPNTRKNPSPENHEPKGTVTAPGGGTNIALRGKRDFGGKRRKEPEAPLNMGSRLEGVRGGKSQGPRRKRQQRHIKTVCIQVRRPEEKKNGKNFTMGGGEGKSNKRFRACGVQRRHRVRSEGKKAQGEKKSAVTELTAEEDRRPQGLLGERDPLPRRGQKGGGKNGLEKRGEGRRKRWRKTGEIFPLES